MFHAPIMLALIQSLTAAPPDSAYKPVDSLPNAYLTRCMDLGDMLDKSADSVAFSLKPLAMDSNQARKWPPLVSLGAGVYLEGRRLDCVGPAKILRRTDTSIIFGLTRGPLAEFRPPNGLPLFSLGAGISFDGAFTLHGELPALMNRSVDSSNAYVGQYQVQPNFDVQIGRMVGFRWSPGFGGDFSIPSGDDPAIELSYREVRYGPFLELPLRAFWKDAFPLSLRVGYLWISGSLELGSDTLRKNLIDYDGHRSVHVDVDGKAWDFSVLLGDQFFLQLDLYLRSIYQGNRALVSGANLGLGLGARL